MKKSEIEKRAEAVRMTAVALTQQIKDLKVDGGPDMCSEIVDYIHEILGIGGAGA